MDETIRREAMPVQWSKYGRGEKLIIAKDLLDQFCSMVFGAKSIASAYSVLSELEAVLASCEDTSNYGHLHDDTYITQAYRSFTRARTELSKQVETESCLTSIEDLLKTESGETNPDGTEVVWFLEGNFPEHKRGRETLIYLCMKQLDSRGKTTGAHQTLSPVGQIPSNIIVKTPLWIVSYLRTAARMNTGDVYKLSGAEIDYLRGLWVKRTNREGFEELLKIAKTLARGENSRRL
jgi:hypothetical protein